MAGGISSSSSLLDEFLEAGENRALPELLAVRPQAPLWLHRRRLRSPRSPGVRQELGPQPEDQHVGFDPQRGPTRFTSPFPRAATCSAAPGASSASSPSSQRVLPVLARYRDEHLSTTEALLDAWFLVHALNGGSTLLQRAPLGVKVVFRVLTRGGHGAGPAVHRSAAPQGEPRRCPVVGPLIANAISRKLDRRLRGRLAKKGWVYTRYADHLSFSKKTFTRGELGFVHASIRHVVQDEGFALNPQKGRAQGRGGRQDVTGIVVNVKPGVPRDELKRLRAILHQAKKTGLEAQNRDKVPDYRRVLEGKIAYVMMVDRAKGQKLKAALDEVTG